VIIATFCIENRYVLIHNDRDFDPAKEKGMYEYQIAHDLASQFLAGLFTLKDCIDRCPDADWNEKHNDYPFSQVVFHVLLDCDYCLCENKDDLPKQQFHRKNQKIFDGYEELSEAPRAKLYEKDFIDDYYNYCIAKVEEMARTKTNNEMLIAKSDIYKNMTKLERYTNAIRHTQHHAAQLGLRLQLITKQEMEWISRGYK
jgi:hypothetical protein